MELSHFRLWFCSVVVLLASVGGCAGISTIESHKEANALVIDGDTKDWSGVLRPVEDQRFSLGVSNDSEYLYLSVMTRDQNVSMQIIRDGLVVWLDGGGKDEERFGIRFPIGLTELGIGRQTENRNRPFDPAELEDNFRMSLSQLEISTEDGRWTRFPRSEAHGIDAQARYEFGTLSYELKVPLGADNGVIYTAPARPGSVIKLGIETFDAERPGLGPSNRPDGGGFGAAGLGGGLDSDSNEQRRRSTARMAPLNYWVNIQLAQ